MPATIGTKKKLRQRLRLETRAAHLALERRLPIAQGAPSGATYRAHLQFLLGFHEPLEARLRRVPGLPEAVPDLRRRWKTAALRADLGADGTRAGAADTFIPAPSSPSQALGVLYVTEGATLGARVLLPRLRASGVVPGPLGTRYLAGYGERSGAMWHELCRRFDATDRTEADEVVMWACHCFERLHDWFEHCEGGV